MGREGKLLRGEGVVRLYGALWEIWGIIKGFGAGNIMILYVFSEDVTSCAVGNGLRGPREASIAERR